MKQPPEAPAVAPAWQMVPVEPTDTMLMAAARAYEAALLTLAAYSADRLAYAAMLAAAPAALPARDRNMDGAEEFVTAIIMGQPIWPNPWGQDVALAAFTLTDRGSRPTPAALPAMSDERAALTELVACKDLKDAMLNARSDPHYITQADHMESEYDRRKPLAWERARAVIAAGAPALTPRMLTDEEIERCYERAENQSLRPQDRRIAFSFARAIEQALAVPLEQPAADFCDGHCTWRDHHPDCPNAEQPDADHEPR